MIRAGAAWRLLPAEFGSSIPIDKRFAPPSAELGQEKGVWQRLIDRFAAEGDDRVPRRGVAGQLPSAFSCFGR